ncbi:MAG: SDR family NAD(P)-dependent oxidoreductase [Spirochaetales bacterium]|nr:SDR family NAD(P)-dependent oxidoreductase [Spirochaetales bacterium]
MKPKNILITGTTIGGIGFEAALELAPRGHKLYITTRSLQRAEAAADRIDQEIKKLRPEPYALDISDSASINELATKIKDGGIKLDVLINNAGILKLGRHYTAEGIELTRAVNYHGTRDLTEALLPAINDGGRIINVSSIVSAYGQKERENSSGFKAYCDSKQALNLYTQELALRLSGRRISVNALHPGSYISNIWKGIWPESRIMTALIGLVEKSGMLSVRKGAVTMVYLADSQDVEKVTGEYFKNRRSIPWPRNCRYEGGTV